MAYLSQRLDHAVNGRALTSVLWEVCERGAVSAHVGETGDGADVWQADTGSRLQLLLPRWWHKIWHWCTRSKYLFLICTITLLIVKVLLLRFCKYLQWCPKLRQMLESTFSLTLHVRVASNTHKIPPSDWLKWRCVLMSSNFPAFLLDQKSLQMFFYEDTCFPVLVFHKMMTMRLNVSRLCSFNMINYCNT